MRPRRPPHRLDRLWLRACALVALAAVVVAGATGCKRSPDGPAGDEQHTELMVFAASSLTDAFKDLAQAFEKAHPRVDVVLHFAGSQALRTQIENGARADVFASANRAHMQALEDAELVDAAETFAHNGLIIVVPPDNPAHIRKVRDLSRAERLVLGAEQVPAGRYARTFLARATERFGPTFRDGVDAAIASNETNVRLVLAKVAMGEADAGIVYRTDAHAAADQVDTVELPGDLDVRANYPIATLREAAHPALARQWVDFVESADGQAVLTRHGFVSDAQAQH